MSYSYLIIKRDTKPDDPANLQHALLKNKVSLVARKHLGTEHPFITLQETLRYAYQLPHPGKECEYAIIRCHERPSEDKQTVALGVVSTYVVPAADSYCFGTTTYSEPIKLTLSQTEWQDMEMLEKNPVANPVFQAEAIAKIAEYEPIEEKFHLASDTRDAVLKLLNDEIKRLNGVHQHPSGIVEKRLTSLQAALNFFNAKKAICYQEAFVYLGNVEKDQIGLNQNKLEKGLRGLFGIASSVGQQRIQKMITALKAELALREPKKGKIHHRFR